MTFPLLLPLLFVFAVWTLDNSTSPTVLRTVEISVRGAFHRADKVRRDGIKNGEFIVTVKVIQPASRPRTDRTLRKHPRAEVGSREVHLRP